MTRNIKTLGLALVAVFAFSAVIASAAQANVFMAESYPVHLKGEQVAGEKHVFEITGSKVECSTAKFTTRGAQLTAASGEATIDPVYETCTAFGFVGSEVKMNGCHYKFHVGHNTAADVYEGTVDLICPTGSEVEIIAGTCVAKMAAQSGLSKVEYINMTEVSPKDVTVKAKVEHIKVNVTASGFLCPLTTGVHEGAAGAKYTGNTTVTGIEKTLGTAVGITVEGTE
jgi:hypothetical protein